MQTQTRTRGLSRLATTAILLASWQNASAVDVSWNRMQSAGLHIAGNVSDEVWLIGLDRVSESGYSIHALKNGNWIKQAGAGRRIALDPSGVAWMVDDQNKIYRYNAGSSSWQVLPGLATDIAAGGDGSIWVIGLGKVTGGHGIHKWDSNAQNWSAIPGAGVRIAVERDGSPWVVNDNGEIFRYNLQSRTWSLKPGKARSVHAGMTSGAVWVIGTESIPGGYPVSRYIPATQGWEPYGSYGAVAITEVRNTPWIIQADGYIFTKAADVILSSVETITTTTPGNNTVTPVAQAPTPQLTPLGSVAGPGKLLCSQTGLTTCGDTKTDYVGAYALDTTCDSGFYDMIHGGTCWKCPDDTDDRGSWIRSATAVDRDDACWRIPKEKTGSAIKVKSPAWAWDCPSGSFWDGFSPDGIGGSCWKCPADLPRRTAAPVWASNACASSLNETKPAILLTFNGCPTPNATSMDLPGKRSPGKPFLDIAAGWHQGVASGGCYACPIVDEAGNFLITERNANPIYDKNNNTGCTIKMKWQPPPFREPGLAYMQGVKDVIWEQRLFDGDQITGFLYDLAEAKGHGDATPAAKVWVATRWQEIAKNPYNSESLRTIVFALLKTALKKTADQRTPAEQKLIQSFASHVRDRRTYLAEQALAMYDAWKAYDEQYRQQTGQTKSLSQLFYYGTVPLDFHGMLTSLTGLGGFGGGLIGSMFAASQFAQGVVLHTAETAAAEEAVVGTVMRSKSLFGLTEGLKIFQSAHGLTAVSGATIIAVAGAILSSIASDQLMAIESARPKLVATVAQAKEPVDLDVLAKSTNGEDMLYFYWAKAMDTIDVEDPQVVQLAVQAQTRAQQSGYLAPPKNVLLPVSQISVGDRISSGTGPASPFTSAGLSHGQMLVSANGKFRAIMQSDGNFVIYEGERALWASNSNGQGRPPYRLAVQPDGNLVVYGSSDKDVTLSSGICRANSPCIATWAIGQRGGKAPYTLIMQDDGNLALYDSEGRHLWSRMHPN